MFFQIFILFMASVVIFETSRNHSWDESHSEARFRFFQLYFFFNLERDIPYFFIRAWDRQHGHSTI